MIIDSAYCWATGRGYPFMCSDGPHIADGIVFSKFAKTAERKPPFLFIGFTSLGRMKVQEGDELDPRKV
jgi:hypothetical protein